MPWSHDRTFAGALADSGLLIRPARPSDDAACKALEVSASQFQDRLTNGRLLKFALHHYGRFDAKCAQFADWVVLVCEDTTRGGAVVGVIEVVLAEMHVHGAARRGGFLFDLRVDGGYQRRGIGRALSHEAEAASAARGAAYLYLSVNGTNQKSRSLFNSMGWRPASRRCLVFRPLLLPQKAAAAAASLPPAAWPAPLEREAAERMAATHYARRDLGLDRTGFGSLFSSELYLGTWHAKDGAGSEAALSLWAGSAFVGFLPVRLLFLPARAWGYVILPALGAAAALGLAAAGARLWANAAAVAGAAAAPVVRAGLVAAAAAAATAAWRVIGFVRGRTAVRARAIAPVYSGPNWEPLMRAVHAAVVKEARDRGFAVIVMNIDADDPLAAALGVGGRAPTIFLQRSLSGKGEAELPPLAPGSFFDPRPW